MSLTTEIKALLSTIPAVYIGSLPATPNDVVGIYNTGGFPRGLTESKIEQSTFQIRVRNASYGAGEALCSTIDELLHGHNINAVRLIKNMGGINDLGRDANNRAEFTMNYQTIIIK